MASSYTYCERHLLCKVFGVQTFKDDDGNAGATGPGARPITEDQAIVIVGPGERGRRGLGAVPSVLQGDGTRRTPGEPLQRGYADAGGETEMTKTLPSAVLARIVRGSSASRSSATLPERRTTGHETSDDMKRLFALDDRGADERVDSHKRRRSRGLPEVAAELFVIILDCEQGTQGVDRGAARHPDRFRVLPHRHPHRQAVGRP